MSKDLKLKGTIGLESEIQIDKKKKEPTTITETCIDEVVLWLDGGTFKEVNKIAAFLTGTKQSETTPTTSYTANEFKAEGYWEAGVETFDYDELKLGHFDGTSYFWYATYSFATTQTKALNQSLYVTWVVTANRVGATEAQLTGDLAKALAEGGTLWDNGIKHLALYDDTATLLVRKSPPEATTSTNTTDNTFSIEAVMAKVTETLTNVYSAVAEAYSTTLGTYLEELKAPGFERVTPFDISDKESYWIKFVVSVTA